MYNMHVLLCMHHSVPVRHMHVLLCMHHSVPVRHMYVLFCMYHSVPVRHMTIGFIIILSLIGVLRIPEEFYLYKDKDKDSGKHYKNFLSLIYSDQN
jgi:hypothetical protein